MLEHIVFIAAVVLLHIMPVILGILGGYYNAFQTAKADLPGINWFWLLKHPAGIVEWMSLQRYVQLITFRQEILDKGSAIREGFTYNANDLWYVGGNNYYPEPGNFISNKNDAFHRWKHMWIFMISFIAAYSMLLGMLYMFWYITAGFSTWWAIGMAYTILQAALQYFLQGEAFSKMYYDGLDGRITSTPSWMTKFICALFDDYKYPTSAVAVDYSHLSGRT